jgi:hypothetical protein
MEKSVSEKKEIKRMPTKKRAEALAMSEERQLKLE